MILAHGVGTRSDLPLPVWLAAVRTQYPLLAAMVALTMGAVGLVFAG